MANERTVLAYVRTVLGFVVVGIPAGWWLEQPAMRALGAVSLVTGVVILGIGIWRFVSIKAVIDQQPD